MKILYYSPHPDLSLHSPSGYGTHMREMIKAFEEAGHEVRPLIVGDLKGDGAQAPGNSLSKLKSVTPTWLWVSIKDALLQRADKDYQQALLEVIEREKPDFIYERAAYLQPSGVRAAKQSGIPHCLEMNSPYIDENRVLRQSPSAMERQANRVEFEQLTTTTKTAVVSAGLIDYFVDKHRLSPDRFICTPNGIDPSTVVATPGRVNELLDQHNLRQHTVIGFVGSIIKWQRVDLLIEAFSLVARRHADIKLVIVGDSPLLPEMKQFARDLGVMGNTVFAGRVSPSDVYNYIAAMDIAVLPDNLWYGSPTKLFEYGALGKAVIAPDNTTIAQLITDGIDGLLTESRPDHLAQHIQFLIENEAERQSMAARFQSKVMDSYTWRHNAEAVLETLAEKRIVIPHLMRDPAGLQFDWIPDRGRG